MRKTFASVLGLLLVAGTVGCGEKAGGTGGPGAGGITAESFDPKSPVGTWLMDTKPIADMMKPMMEIAKAGVEMLPAGPEKDKAMKEFTEKMGGFDKMKFAVTLKKDGTMVSDVDMPGEETETGTGVWTQSGDTVTITPKTKNGKPVEGNSAESKAFTFKDGTLSGSDGGMTLNFRRK